MMLNRLTPIFFTNIKRCYVLSSKRNDDTTGSLPNRSNEENSFHYDKLSNDDLESLDLCKKTMAKIEAEGPIDYESVGSIPLDWSTLPDEDFVNFQNQQKSQQEPPTTSEGSHQSSGSFQGDARHAGGDRTRFSAGDLVILFTQDLGRKRRPAVILSSSFHNRLNGARILIAPLSSQVNNTVLHRFIITPHDTRHGQVIKSESNILFDYSSVVSPKYLKPTHDALQHDVLKQTLIWWQRCVKLIMSDI